MRRLALLAALAAVAACQQPAEPAPAPAPTPAPAPAPTPPGTPTADWQSASSGEGVGLSLIEAGRPVITLSCLRSPLETLTEVTAPLSFRTSGQFGLSLGEARLVPNEGNDAVCP